MTPQSTPAPAVTPQDDNQLMVERQGKLAALRAAGIAFPNDIKPAHRAEALFAQYDGKTPACVHVNQDGSQFNAPDVFDRLIG